MSPRPLLESPPAWSSPRLRVSASARSIARHLVAASLALGAGCAQEPPPPHIVFETASYDFGQVEEGETVRHNFFFRNQGGSSLSVDEVRASCGCTAAVIAGEVVGPKESGAIQVTFDTSNLAGEQRKTLTIYSSDPGRPVVTLEVAARVDADVVADPPELYVGRLPRGAAVRRDILIRALRPGVGVRRVEASGTALQVVLSHGADDPDARIAVSIRPSAGLGPFAEDVRVLTSSTRQPLVVVPVAGTVEGDVTVEPAHATFGTVRGDAPASQVLLVRNASPRPVAVRAGRVSSPAAAVDVQAVRPGFEYLVTVRLHTGLVPGVVDGVIELETDHPEQARIEVPLRATVRASS